MERASSAPSETQQARRWACPRLPCRGGLRRASAGRAGVHPAHHVWPGSRRRAWSGGPGASSPGVRALSLPATACGAAAATVRPQRPPPTRPGWPLGAQPSTCGSARLHTTGSVKGGRCQGTRARGDGRSARRGSRGGHGQFLRPPPPSFLQPLALKYLLSEK